MLCQYYIGQLVVHVHHLSCCSLDFPVAWFSMCRQCPLHSIQTILYPALHFKPHLPDCLFLKNTLSQILKLGRLQFVVLWACLNQFLLRVFLAMAGAMQCDLR